MVSSLFGGDRELASLRLISNGGRGSAGAGSDPDGQGS